MADDKTQHAFTVGTDEAGQRLDRFLTGGLPGFSRSRVQGLIASGQATLNGATIGDGGYRVKPGDLITIGVPPSQPAEPVGEAISIKVVYEDDALIVVDKPAGLVVHPAPGHAGGTLVNALIAHCGDSLSGIGGVKRPGIVHRLDKDTTGLIVAAKTDAAHHGLAEQFAAHGRDGRLERAYLAVVWGALPAVVGTIDAPLKRSAANRTRMQVTRGNRPLIGKGGAFIEDDEDEEDETGDGRRPQRGVREAVTHYQVIETFKARDGGGDGSVIASLIKAELETGRTHQIRVHLAHIGHPLLGDPSYGAGFKASTRRLTGEQVSALERLDRQALHAAVLGFEHPVTGDPLRFESEVPADMAELIQALRGPVTTALAPAKRNRKTQSKPKGISPGKRSARAPRDPEDEILDTD